MSFRLQVSPRQQERKKLLEQIKGLAELIIQEPTHQVALTYTNILFSILNQCDSHSEFKKTIQSYRKQLSQYLNQECIPLVEFPESITGGNWLSKQPEKLENLSPFNEALSRIETLLSDISAKESNSFLPSPTATDKPPVDIKREPQRDIAPQQLQDIQNEKIPIAVKKLSPREMTLQQLQDIQNLVIKIDSPQTYNIAIEICLKIIEKEKAKEKNKKNIEAKITEYISYLNCSELESKFFKFNELLSSANDTALIIPCIKSIINIFKNPTKHKDNVRNMDSFVEDTLNDKKTQHYTSEKTRVVSQTLFANSDPSPFDIIETLDEESQKNNPTLNSEESEANTAVLEPIKDLVGTLDKPSSFVKYGKGEVEKLPIFKSTLE